MPESFRQEDRDRLVRLEERLVALKEDIGVINDRIDYERDQAKTNYVSKAENEPVKRFVYAMSGFLMTSVLGMILMFIFKGGHF